MEKNNKRLAEIGEKALEEMVKGDIYNIQLVLECLEDESNIVLAQKNYEEHINKIKEECGIEFPELQKEYNELLQKINIYLRTEIKK